MCRMATIRSICVYCGSSPGKDPAFINTARAFGKIMAENGVTLVYGGGSHGLMGAVGTGVIENGGKVIGVIPEFLKSREQMLPDASEMIVTDNMHARKQIMFERADAFVALPGGIGTLEELIEQLTWLQLGRHNKPILFANVNGFWNPLVELLNHMKKNGFIHSDLKFEYGVADKVEDILPQLRAAAAKYDEAEKHGDHEKLKKM
jgi:uncharacterized protein (TIGR00730 family)